MSRFGDNPRTQSSWPGPCAGEVGELTPAAQRRAQQDAHYRAALGLPEDGALPAQLGTVGGSRGGHAEKRINQATTGQPALWHVEARRAAATRHRIDWD